MAPKRLNPSSALLLAWDVAADDEDKRTDVRGMFISGVRPDCGYVVPYLLLFGACKEVWNAFGVCK